MVEGRDGTGFVALCGSDLELTMRQDAIKTLRCPACRGVLRVSVFRRASGEVQEGFLRCLACAEEYPVVAGMPRMVLREHRKGYSGFWAKHKRGIRGNQVARGIVNEAEHRTVESFSHKWDLFPAYAVGNPEHEMFYDLWTASKFGFESVEELHAYFRDKQTILDVGCGVGQKLRMMARNSPGQVYGFDLSSAAIHAYENTKDLRNVTVAQADLMRPPFGPGQFDFVMADGVLHHTSDTRKAFLSVVPLVKPGGAILIHVYKKMGPVREMTDAYLRSRITKMTPEEAWDACRPITNLGKALTHLNVDITVPEDIPLLEIKAGTYNLQRFLYYQVLKCFWNDIFTFEENNFGVFDHYHPTYARKHTEEEVVSWFQEASLKDIVVHQRSPNGISVVAKAPKD